MRSLWILALAACSSQAPTGNGNTPTAPRPPGMEPPAADAGEDAPVGPCGIGGQSRPLHNGPHPTIDILPEAYSGVTNTMPKTSENAAAGKVIFEARCLSCHGSLGHGDGPSATGLDPPVADLASGPLHTQPYYFWRISEGGRGEPMCSSMPAFKDRLSADDRWRLVLYILKLNEPDGGWGPVVAPTMKAATPMGGSLHVTWSNNANCDRVEIDRNKDGSAFSKLVTITAGQAAHHDSEAIAPGTYCYRARCGRWEEVSADSNEVCGTP